MICNPHQILFGW